MAGILPISTVTVWLSAAGMGFGQRTGEQILGKREAAQHLKLALAKACPASGPFGSPYILQQLCYKNSEKAS